MRIVLILLTLAAIAHAAEPFVTIPDTVSPQAAEFLRSYSDPSRLSDWPAGDDLGGWKRAWEAREKNYETSVQAALKKYEPTIEQKPFDDVLCLRITPREYKPSEKLLIYTHGGAHTLGSAHSTLPVAAMVADATGLRVLSIDYTVAPQGRWQQQIAEVITVLNALKKQGVSMKNVALLGDSAGGALAAGATLCWRDHDNELPAALVLWAPWADITDAGDTAVTLKNADPAYVYAKHLKPAADAYADAKDQKHPHVSPVYGDFAKGFPPTLIQVGTKEIFLSHAVRLYRKIDDGGGTAVLDVYEGMPHVFQPAIPDAPETKTCLKKMAAFLNERVKG